MKQVFIKFFALVALVCSFCLSASAVKLDGKHYQGIAKIEGEMVDCWVNMEFDDTDVEFNISDTYNFATEYTKVEKGETIYFKVSIGGKSPVTFTSKDGGSTFEGKFSHFGQNFNLWVLEIPSKLVETKLPTDEIDKIVGSSDGYTSFVTLKMSNGQEMCVTSDFILSDKDHSFSMTCDSSTMTNIFSSMKGTYSIDGSSITLTDVSGKVVKGTIFDDGNYIKIPIGEASNMIINLILIR